MNQHGSKDFCLQLIDPSYRSITTIQMHNET